MSVKPLSPDDIKGWLFTENQNITSVIKNLRRVDD